jgi:hypothetical protein
VIVVEKNDDGFDALGASLFYPLIYSGFWNLRSSQSREARPSPTRKFFIDNPREVLVA